MPKTIIGSFVFKDEGDGCLTSKYLEHSNPKTYTECCKIIGIPTNVAFEGVYDTTWIEGATGFRTAELKVSKNATDEFFELKWTKISNISTGIAGYEGRAFLADGKLVGCYWDV
jgi:hypothetical protein